MLSILVSPKEKLNILNSVFSKLQNVAALVAVLCIFHFVLA